MFSQGPEKEKTEMKVISFIVTVLLPASPHTQTHTPSPSPNVLFLFYTPDLLRYWPVKVIERKEACGPCGEMASRVMRLLQ